MRTLQELRMEAHLGGVRLQQRISRSTRSKRRELATRRKVKLHFGCGSRIIPGWVNVDGWATPGIDLVTDLRQPLPLADGSCEFIFTEHVFEHIDQTFRLKVLRELHRLLSDDGVLRLVVPDIDLFVRAYDRRDLEWFDTVFETTSTSEADAAAGLNNVFGHFHRFIDDYASMSALLREARFTRVHRSALNESALPDLRIDTALPARALCSLYVEASR